MQIVPLGSNGPQISKKVFGQKNLTQINKLTLKIVMHEQWNTKTSNIRKKKKRNAPVRSYYVLYVQLDR